MNIERMVFMSTNAAPAAQEAQNTQNAQQAPEAEEVKALPHQIKPVHGFDTYVPEDKTLHESIGIYRVYDRNGTPKVQFDHTPAEEKEEEPVNVTTTNTDEVDREIERLKEKQEELSQKVEREQDPQRREQLERELAQVEQELSEKDNDTYRRQHAVIS